MKRSVGFGSGRGCFSGPVIGWEARAVTSRSGIARVWMLLGLLVAVIAALSYQLWSAKRYRDRVARANVAIDEGRPEHALYLIRPLLDSRRPNVELVVLGAKTFRLLGEPSRSLQLTNAATERGDDSEELRLEHALALFELGRFQEAEPLLKSLSSQEAAAALTVLYIRMLQMDKALASVHAWIALDPDVAMPRVILGDIWMEAADFDKAIQAYRKALELAPDSVDAKRQLANALIERGELDEASQLLEDYNAAWPGDMSTLLALARCEAEQGKIDAARTRLEQLVAAEPNIAAAQLQLGKIELDDGNIDRAVKLLERAVELEPMNESSLYNLATALKRSDREHDAAAIRDRWEAVRETRRQLTECLENIGQDPTDISEHLQAAKLYQELDNSQKALEHYAIVLTRAPENAEAAEGLARLRGDATFAPIDIGAGGAP